MEKYLIARVTLVLSVFIGWVGCNPNSNNEKYQSHRNNVVDVRDRVQEIAAEEVLISNIAWINFLDDYLIISDYKSADQCIHLLDRTSYNYVMSIGEKGQGPSEIAGVGHIEVDEKKHRFFLTDTGKRKVVCYELDSVLANPAYVPPVKTTLMNERFPILYTYISDTLCIGLIMEPTGNSGFNELTAKWNMSTGEIAAMKYSHPNIERKRVCLAVAPEHGIYAECYKHHDLITICNLEGELVCNIFGSKWDDMKTNSVLYYSDVLFCKDRIVVSSSFGRDNFGEDYYPTDLLVFDLEGNYLRTLHIGYRIITFSYDSLNNRIIFLFDDTIQLGRLDLDGLI